MPEFEAPICSNIINTKTITLTEKDVRDAERLFCLISGKTPWSSLVLSEREVPCRSSAESSPREELILRARMLLYTRRLRARHFNRVMFSEPAWDILLLLYLADSSEGRQTIGHVAELVETPLTTVLRWVGYLEREGLVERKDHPTDRRTVFIRLVDKGRNALNTFLEELPQ